jgi:hypothetical protein
MAYKEKTCPKCGVTHKKRGEFCSRSCGNARAMPEYQKESIAAAKREWHATSDTAAVAAHNYTSKGLNKDPDPVAPMVARDAGFGRFVEDGDIWEEVN